MNLWFLDHCIHVHIVWVVSHFWTVTLFVKYLKKILDYFLFVDCFCNVIITVEYIILALLKIMRTESVVVMPYEWKKICKYKWSWKILIVPFEVMILYIFGRDNRMRTDWNHHNIFRMKLLKCSSTVFVFFSSGSFFQFFMNGNAYLVIFSTESIYSSTA